MKTLQITADWILLNFSHTMLCSGDGTVNIYCDIPDIKWNELALDGVMFEYDEIYENEIGEFEGVFHFEIQDIKEIAPKFHQRAIGINNANKQAKINRIKGKS